MRAELPWNVAGIPPEAREAARAAARREGLSVGEWLTRRILRDLSELAELGDDESAAKRRDTEEMLARLAEAEAEATDSYRRIEQKLRLVGTDYDTAERSQAESNRAMSRAANEIHSAGREQAEAFDQLGRHMGGLVQRLDRLERASNQDGLKEAVRGLHQGLSRLASELGQATGRSGVQIASLARNLEQLALRLVAARSDAENAAKLLDTRIAVMEEAHHVTADAVDRALERLDDETARRAETAAEAEAREEAQDERLARIEERVGQIESQSQISEQDQRLDEMERALSEVVTSLEKDPGAELAENVTQLAARLEFLERKHDGMLLDLSARLADVASLAATAQQSPGPDLPPAEAPLSESSEEETTEPREEPAPPAVASEEDAPAQSPVPEAHETGLETGAQDIADDAANDDFAPDEFTPDSPLDDFADDAFATHFEMPQDLAEALARPAGATVPFTPAARKGPAEEENFLKAARLSSIAASEEETKVSPFPWRASARETGSNRSLTFLLIAFVLLLAGSAALVLTQRLAEHPAPAKLLPAPKPLPRHAPPSAPKAPPVAPVPAGAPIPAGASDVTGLSAPAPAAQSAAAEPDKVSAAANGGNPAAETVLALQFLDGPTPDLKKAAPWLEKAAEAGQPIAQYRLGTLYERGQGVAANAALAVKWYLAAAQQGNRKAMHNLAVAYADGAAGPKDMAEAARWFAKAAALGLSDSQFNLAVLYERGDGVPQSLADAYKWYAIAAAQGDAESKTRLSLLQTQLPGPDRAAAERAARDFHPLALDRLANLPPEDLGH